MKLIIEGSRTLLYDVELGATFFNIKVPMMIKVILVLLPLY